MKTKFNIEPRVFEVKGLQIKDIGKIQLYNDEMITFITEEGKEYDFTAKDWGFYGTPSMNCRLKKQGFKTALVVNETNQVYIMVVDVNKLEDFKNYLKDDQNNKVICWLDEWYNEEL